MLDQKIALAGIVTAFGNNTIGTKVIDTEQFLGCAGFAISITDFNDQKVPGQAFIMNPNLIPYVSAGVGKRSKNPDDFVSRLYRGNVDLYLKRKMAATVEECAIVVYTREAYLADPDVLKDPVEITRIEQTDCTHVLVAILAFAGPKSPLSPYRLVHNLAGGNNEALLLTADEIRTKAAESKAYHDEWCTVAD